MHDDCKQELKKFQLLLNLRHFQLKGKEGISKKKMKNKWSETLVKLNEERIIVDSMYRSKHLERQSGFAGNNLLWLLKEEIDYCEGYTVLGLLCFSCVFSGFLYICGFIGRDKNYFRRKLTCNPTNNTITCGKVILRVIALLIENSKK